jgi:hypothetical protein
MQGGPRLEMSSGPIWCRTGNTTSRFAGIVTGATGLEPATSGVTGRRSRSRRSAELALERLQFASVLQASAFRSDVTVFRLNARLRPKTSSERAFRRNTAERVYTSEAAHNPEVAGSNSPPLLRKARETGLYLRERLTSERLPVVHAWGIDSIGARRSVNDHAVGRSGISRSLKQALSFGCGLLRLPCSTCVVAPHLASAATYLHVRIGFVSGFSGSTRPGGRGRSRC